MNITYRIRTDDITTEDGEQFTVYGVDVISQSGSIVESVPDIFFDRAQAEKFVSLCNSEQLDFSHLFDVIEDYI